MDVRFSPEQEALRGSVTQVVERFGPKSVGQIDDLERRTKLDVAVVASGWRELRIPCEGGHPTASGVEAAIVAEELGRGLADVPFLGPTLAADLRRLAGAVAGEGTESVLLDMKLSAIAQGAIGAVPVGVAIDALGSSTALLLASDGDSSHLSQVDLLAELNGPDLTRPTGKVDPTSAAAVVEGAAQQVGADDLTRWTALGLALSCADLVGTMRGAVDLACGYAAQRRQFGAPIGSFQAVQHMLADAHVQTEGARSITLHAAWAVDAMSAEDALGAAAMAKAYCARAARSVCETVIQVHGGIGNTWECLAHVYLRRALVSTDLLGDSQASVSRVLAHAGIGWR